LSRRSIDSQEQRTQSEQCGQQDEKHAETVDAEEIADPPFREPLPLFHELHPGGPFIEAEKQGKGEGKFRERPDQNRDPDEEDPFARHQHQQQRAGQGQEDDRAQKGERLVHGSATSRHNAWSRRRPPRAAAV
jgi:hypothetical protein